MCGILGAVNSTFNNDTLRLIEHRGPDDCGIDTFNINNHAICLGQTRLSILDLSTAGHQPMISDCGGYALIFNGEVYNHLDLRKKLPEDFVYNGHSDTETVLRYMMHVGADGVKDFNGMFSIGFLDMVANKLLLARDPFGIKPLYFFQDNGQFIFSSEIKPIISLIKSDNLDKQALASLLRLRYNASPNTLHSDVKKVAPGHMLTVNLNKHPLQIQQKTFIKNAKKKAVGDTNSLIKAYGVELDKAVRRQLISDVEVGVLLSGGVDSAMVAALAKKHYKGKLKAFTIGFEGEYDEDEINDAKETAALLGLEHHVRKISFNDFLGLIKKCSAIVEEPLATTSMIPMYYLAELASEQVKVVLTGQGADEPLGGYTRYRSEVIRNKIPRVIRNMAVPVVEMIGSKNEQLLRGAKSLKVNDDLDRFLTVYEVFTPKEIMGLINTGDVDSRTAVLQFYKVLDCAKMVHSAEKMMAIDTRMNLSDDLLNYTDKITMNFSLECRVPMLDVELVSFIESLPLKLKLNAAEGKIVHKEFAKQLLPHEIINRPKKGFESPTNRWFREEMKTVKGILLRPGTSFAKVFNLQSVEKVLEQHSVGFNKEKQIFLLLSIYYWFERNIVQ